MAGIFGLIPEKGISMSNGNNVPDDCRNSDFWDDGLICPICDEAMTVDYSIVTCDSDQCDYFVDLDDGEELDHE